MRISKECPDDNKVVTRPRWEWLSAEQRLRFGNGVGPWWFTDGMRKVLTGYASFFFDDASWKHHDFGYTKGHLAEHRKEYDQKFLQAMKRDARSLGVGKREMAFLLSYAFYIAVRIGGGGSFFYCHRFRSLDEVIAASKREMKRIETVLPDGLPKDKSPNKGSA